MKHQSATTPENEEKITTSDKAVRKALVDTHQQLHGFLKRRLGSADEADDVLQAFMLRAIERSGQLEDTGSVRGWLSRVLASSIADHQRYVISRRKRETGINPDDLESTIAAPDFELDEVVCDCLFKLLPTLTPEYAEVIKRLDLLGEPREIVAAHLGITINNLTVRLYRARQALKYRLKEMCTVCLANGFLDCGCEADEQRRREQQAV